MSWMNAQNAGSAEQANMVLGSIHDVLDGPSPEFTIMAVNPIGVITTHNTD